MSNQPAIADGHVVTMHYTLKDRDGNVIDSSSGGDPLSYLHGHKNIVPGLERELTGKSVGDSVAAVVPPSEGYGERQGTPQKAPLDAFPDDADLEAGMQLVAQTEDGRQVSLWITSVADDHVVIDPNHPLAGVELHFNVEITDIRDATKEEIDHGHPHGPGGHQH